MDAPFGVFYILFYALYVVKFIMIVLCFMRPSLCRYMIYLDYLRRICEQMMPLGGTNFAGFAFRIVLGFLSSYFDFWINFFTLIPVIGTFFIMFVVNTGEHIYLAAIFFMAAMLSCFLLLLLIHALMNTIGLIVVKNTLVEQGYEILLNNLKEGVVIANKDTGIVMFANQSAKKLNDFLAEQRAGSLYE